MKICRFCHRETFDGRTTCHHCGADVAATPQIALPSRDAATWVRPGPFTSRIGDLALGIDGMVFYAEDGRPLLEVPTRTIRRVRGAQGRDLIVDWEDSRGRRQRARMRVRWAPQADRTLRADHMLRRGRHAERLGLRDAHAESSRAAHAARLCGGARPLAVGPGDVAGGGPLRAGPAAAGGDAELAPAPALDLVMAGRVSACPAATARVAGPVSVRGCFIPRAAAKRGATSAS